MHGKQDLKINTLLQNCHAKVLDTYAMENKEWIVVTEAIEFMLLCWIITWTLILYFFDPLFNATCSSMRWGFFFMKQIIGNINTIMIIVIPNPIMGIAIAMKRMIRLTRNLQGKWDFIFEVSKDSFYGLLMWNSRLMHILTYVLPCET